MLEVILLFFITPAKASIARIGCGLRDRKVCGLRLCRLFSGSYTDIAKISAAQHAGLTNAVRCLELPLENSKELAATF